MADTTDPTPAAEANEDGRGVPPAAPAPADAPAAAVTSAGPAPSEEELKAAYKAFKKRIKIKQLDHDSRVGRAPTSSGSTKIAAIEPPNQYGKEVWDALVAQKKLNYCGHGMYEMR